MTNKLSQADLKLLKRQCFIPQVEEGFFSMRLKVIGGLISAAELQKVAEIAQEYARGTVHLTSRQGLEIPFVPFDNIEAIKEALKAKGLELGNCGPGLRTVTACQGTLVCGHGNIDTQTLARAIEARYRNVVLPHKFKIGITGCFNNCLKAEENDVGIKGGFKPDWIRENCTYCGACVKKCPVKAITVNKKKEHYNLDDQTCINCGKCVKACPKAALKGEPGFVVYFGGLYGHQIAIGRKLPAFISSVEELFALIDSTVDFYQKHGQEKERLGKAIKRLGWPEFLAALKSSN